MGFSKILMREVPLKQHAKSETQGGEGRSEPHTAPHTQEATRSQYIAVADARQSLLRRSIISNPSRFFSDGYSPK